MKWTIEKDYRDNDRLRHSFNELAKETFGLDLRIGIGTVSGGMIITLIPS